MYFSNLQAQYLKYAPLGLIFRNFAFGSQAVERTLNRSTLFQVGEFLWHRKISAEGRTLMGWNAVKITYILYSEDFGSNLLQKSERTSQTNYITLPANCDRKYQHLQTVFTMMLFVYTKQWK
jgi:hypothetical protein